MRLIGSAGQSDGWTVNGAGAGLHQFKRSSSRATSGMLPSVLDGLSCIGFPVHQVTAGKSAASTHQSAGYRVEAVAAAVEEIRSGVLQWATITSRTF